MEEEILAQPPLSVIAVVITGCGRDNRR
jgi:hypothetical protein